MGEQKRVLVTGAAGFLGSRLCRFLLEDGYAVVGLDNLFTGSQDALRPLMAHPGFEFVYHDVIKPFPEEIGPISGLMHLACPASPPHYQKDPVYTVKTAFLGTLHALEYAQVFQAHLVHASTSEVYGSPERHPQDESYWGHVNPHGIRACYDEGKRASEALCFDFHRTRKLSLSVARIFNTYGPGMNPSDGRVVSSLVVQALTDRPLTIYGSGEQTRSFCYLDDTVQGLITLLEKGRGLAGPFNIGNPHEITILELAHLVQRLTRADSSIRMIPLPQDDPPRRCPSISRMYEYFGWQPSVDLNQGLAQTIEYFRSLDVEICQRSADEVCQGQLS